MKNAILKSKLILMIFTALLALSCDGEDGMDGDMGLQGVQGEQGLSGIDGVDGTNGVDGTDGNANVIASAWIPNEFPDTPDTYAEFNFTDLNLTSEIANSAVILVYGRSAFTGVVAGIPITLTEQSYYFVINTALNQILFAANSLDGTDRTFDVFGDFRYVIVPSSITSGKSSRPDFSKMSYEEVMDYFELEY